MDCDARDKSSYGKESQISTPLAKFSRQRFKCQIYQVKID